MLVESYYKADILCRKLKEMKQKKLLSNIIILADSLILNQQMRISEWDKSLHQRVKSEIINYYPRPTSTVDRTGQIAKVGQSRK